jgi:hypothetical protein
MGHPETGFSKRLPPVRVCKKPLSFSFACLFGAPVQPFDQFRFSDGWEFTDVKNVFA